MKQAVQSACLLITSRLNSSSTCFWISVEPLLDSCPVQVCHFAHYNVLFGQKAIVHVKQAVQSACLLITSRLNSSKFHPTTPCYSHLIGPLSCVTLAAFITPCERLMHSPAVSSISCKSIPVALPRYSG